MAVAGPRRFGSKWPSPWLAGAVLLMVAIAVLLIVDLSRSPSGRRIANASSQQREGSAEAAAVRLVGIDLTGERLVDLTAPNTDLSGANLATARLIGARLAGALLYGACLRGTVLIGADLARAQLDGADVRGADFTGANLDHADFSRAVYDEKTRWPGGRSPAGATLAPAPRESC